MSKNRLHYQRVLLHLNFDLKFLNLSHEAHFLRHSNDDDKVYEKIFNPLDQFHQELYLHRKSD